MNVLVVEDEKGIRDSLKKILELKGYNVEVAVDGEEGLIMGRDDLYDVILLDLMMPKMSGIEVLRALRLEMIDTKIIILSAKGDVESKVSGLDLGADDYLEKPFEGIELIARINAVSRRKELGVINNIMKIGDISLNIKSMNIAKTNKKVDLSHREFKLLKYFAESSSIKSKEDIFFKIWGMDSDVDYSNIEVYISLLRKKLTYLGSEVEIKAVRNMGYILKVKDV